MFYRRQFRGRRSKTPRIKQNATVWEMLHNCASEYTTSPKPNQLNCIANIMILSIYTYIFTENNSYYLYNSQSNFFSEISEDLYKSLKNRTWNNLPETIKKQLISQKILVAAESKYDYYNSQRLFFNTHKYNSTRLSLVIAPTTTCNFDCPYCFEPKRSPKTITSEIIKNIREFVKSFSDVKTLDITWYGGEPLLAFDRIKQIHSILTEKGMPEINSQSIVTNGYLFTDDVVRFFNSVGLNNIQITLDGTKEQHNATRCLKSSHQPTFDIILNNIDLILREMPKTKLSIRVNIKKSTSRQYLELLDYFRRKYPESNLNIYPGLIREETPDGKSIHCDCYTSEEVSDLNKLVKAAGHEIRLFPRKEQRGCMAHALNSYIIGPEGELYKCWNDVSDPNLSVGNIASGKLTGSTRLLDFMTETTPFNSECRECHAFPICSGGCGYYRLRNYKEGACFAVCSPYKDFSKLKEALLSGIKPEFA